MYQKIKTFAEIKEIVEKARKDNKKVVFTNGVFDLVHIGHTRYLEKAKMLGDILIIGINSDSSVKEYKCEKKPIIPENERAEILSSIRYVDYVFLFDDVNISAILNKLKPEIWCKGGDYELNKLNKSEKEMVENYGEK
ncbi:MAG: adenylyltransferase/cytidyltransferase family protein [Nanoarchaeota archaeon]|nr:adenylyltransferase/cytidyltransferase family protein [Nanoarchaeota archaeon]